jgi:hypothetical protein
MKIMANKSPSHKFPANNRIAAENGNTRGRRVKKSKLRKTEEALRKLEPKSLENIELSVNGEDVDKEAVASSKWVITNIMAVGKAAAAEEELINGTRLLLEAADKEDEEAQDDPNPSLTHRFSTSMVVPIGKKDL